MSTDAVKKFLELAQANSELNNQMKTVVAERGEESSFELVELAASHDCEFTATELVEYLTAGKAKAELSDADLETVTGGISYLRTLLGRRANIFSPSLMTKREQSDPGS